MQPQTRNAAFCLAFCVLTCVLVFLLAWLWFIVRYDRPDHLSVLIGTLAVCLVLHQSATWIPKKWILRLRSAGLLVMEGDALHICHAWKPSAVPGNSVEGHECLCGDERIPVNAPKVTFFRLFRRWHVVVHEYKPGPGPGDFHNVHCTAEEAIADIEDYYFGDPARMEVKSEENRRFRERRQADTDRQARAIINHVCPPDPDEVLFFPAESLDGRADLGEFKSAWYSKHLHSMGEPLLSNATPEVSFQIRFLWLRTNHAPVAVRVFESDVTAKIVLKTTHGQGGYETGAIDKHGVKTLSPADLAVIKAGFRGLDFYNLSLEQSVGLDGAEWILEAMIDGRYHVVTRWSPASGDLREFCLLMMKYAGFSPKEVY